MRTLQFQAVLGAGAFATVYRAVLGMPGGFAQVVAVKVLREAMDPASCARVRDEARLLGRIVDPRIVGVRELVSVEGRDAVILPLIEGVDLARLLEAGPVPPRAVAELGAELAGALAAAHEATDPETGAPLGVVHRDVKPANVRVGPGGSVALLDFGVAHARFAGRESRTGSQEVLGSPAWMAPEYLREGRLGPEVDVYALGVVLLEAATGQRLGKPRGDAAAHQARVDALCAALPSDAAPLAGVARACVARDPTARPTARALARALASLADHVQGQGLRTWANRCLPAAGSAAALVPADPLALVGRSVSVDAVAEPPEDAATVMVASPPPPVARVASPPAPAPAPYTELLPQGTRDAGAASPVEPTAHLPAARRVPTGTVLLVAGGGLVLAAAWVLLSRVAP
jgi:serine/threonine-protein kinase